MAGETKAGGGAAEQLIAAGWAGLEVLEHAGYLLFPEELLRRRRDGTLERTPVALRVPREYELRQARAWARGKAVDDGLDPDRDADLITNLENIHLLSVSVRNRTPPHEAMVPNPLELERAYDRACLLQLWAKLDKLHALVDPADSEMTPEQTLALMARLASERHLGPLAAYGPAAQASFVLSMVDQCLSFMRRKLSRAPRDSSMPESSAPNGSST